MYKLSELPEHYLRIIDTIFNGFDGALIVDARGIIRVFTDYYARETGLEKEMVLGKRVDVVFPTTRMLEVLETGRPIIADIWELKGKSQIVSRVPITANGQIVGVAGFNIFRYLDEAQGFATRISNMFSELKYYKEEVKRIFSVKYTLASIIGVSEAIIEVKERVKLVAPSSIPVFIYGETGTGKELIAHALHFESSRRNYPFIKVNCASIPENLVESELFGYEEGAFTGARTKGKPGKFELANKGSIFLDEIGDLSLISQAKLLRVLQEKEIEKVGGTTTIPVDVRVISATNLVLTDLVRKGKFRKDLLFRLDVFPIYIPPLRERLQDIIPLIETFINQYNLETGTKIDGVTPEALKILMSYHWPGNVREFYSVMERACIDARIGSITPDNLLRFTNRQNLPKSGQQASLEEIKQKAEKEAIISVLQQTKGNKQKTAELLGISRSTLYTKLKLYKIMN
ncbi:MAG TPA: sigma 54-interacting transcriptional regulator [Syntrophomonadaceae bacterium]|nr:sigma 54-interacting transcriptional regulator [Syntrophomonadaceae bacterium]